MQELILMLPTGASSFTIPDWRFTISRAFVRTPSLNHSLQIADIGQFHKIRPIPKGLGSVIYVDEQSPFYKLDCVLAEDIELHLIDDEVKFKKLKNFDFGQYSRQAYEIVQNEMLHDAALDCSTLSTAEAELLIAQTRIRFFKAEITVLQSEIINLNYKLKELTAGAVTR